MKDYQTARYAASRSQLARPPNPVPGRLIGDRPPLRIRPRPSRILAAYLCVTHGVALAVILALHLGWYWQWGLIAILGVSLVIGFWAYVLLLAPWAVQEAVLRPDGSWTLLLVRGAEIEVRLLPSSFVTQWLVVLNFRSTLWRVYRLVLVADAVHPDVLRQLRVRLRLFSGKHQAIVDT